MVDTSNYYTFEPFTLVRRIEEHEISRTDIPKADTPG